MLHIIVGSKREERKKVARSLTTEREEHVIVLDDTNASFSSLLEYAYPSLFSAEAPIVLGKFLVEGNEDPTKEVIVRLVESPTVFILEEMSMRSEHRKNFEKHGAHLYEQKENKSVKPEGSIFSVTKVITEERKKDRWLIWQNMIEEHPPEALIGILYWKLRKLLETAKGEKSLFYKKYYRALLLAQKDSWQKGYPLVLAIEKVILTL